MPSPPLTPRSAAARALAFLKRARDVRHAGGPGIRQQVSDFRYFHRTTRISPIEFHRYRLWDRSRSMAERLAFMSHAEQRQLEVAVNPRDAVAALNDKAGAIRRLTAAGIRLPETIGQLMVGTSSTADLADLERQLIELCQRAPAAGLVIKPNRGQGGYHVQVFSGADSRGLIRLDGAVLTHRDVAELLIKTWPGLWIAEKRLLPHPGLARFAPLAIASMRVQSIRTRDGVTHLGPAVLKLPIGTSGVDNYGSGNIAAPVDLSDGTVGLGTMLDGARQLERHPTTGAPLDTLRLPDLPEALALVHAAAEVLQELPFLGWDVAFAADGPVILEGNAWSGLDIHQMTWESGIVTGRFVEMLEERGLGHLLRRREAALVAAM